MIFDTLIIGGGVSGMQCALVLGSGLKKPFASDKNVGIIIHQRSSHLQNALFNNVLGLPSGTLGADILASGKRQIAENYPEILQLEKEKVTAIARDSDLYKVTTNKCEYHTKIVVLALNYANPFTIQGLASFLEPHKRANASKNRIQLKHRDYLVKEGLYVCGTLAGVRSQYAIAAGSGASVATDILTLWNNGVHTKIHDKL